MVPSASSPASALAPMLTVTIMIAIGATSEKLSTVNLSRKHDGSLTAMTSGLCGTPAYMAPEQLAGGPADALSDQYAFCVALWEALYGQRPFHGDTVVSLVFAGTAAFTFPVLSVVAGCTMFFGVLGLYMEISNPGAIFPGVVGAICLLSGPPR